MHDLNLFLQNYC